MKNKQHEYILKAFLESSIPTVMRSVFPELMAIDSILGGVLRTTDKAIKIHRTSSKQYNFKNRKNCFFRIDKSVIGNRKR